MFLKIMLTIKYFYDKGMEGLTELTANEKVRSKDVHTYKYTWWQVLLYFLIVFILIAIWLFAIWYLIENILYMPTIWIGVSILLLFPGLGILTILIVFITSTKGSTNIMYQVPNGQVPKSTMDSTTTGPIKNLSNQQLSSQYTSQKTSTPTTQLNNNLN